MTGALAPQDSEGCEPTAAILDREVKTDGSWGSPEGGTGLGDTDFAGTADPCADRRIDGCEPQLTEKKELSFEGTEDPLPKAPGIRIYGDETRSRDVKTGK